MEAQIGPPRPRTVLMTSGADRWGMSIVRAENGYEGVFGDPLFGLGCPLPLRSAASMKRVAALILPIVSRLPFDWLYPTGEKQESNTPKFGNGMPGHRSSPVIVISSNAMPARLDGKNHLHQHDDTG